MSTSDFLTDPGWLINAHLLPIDEVQGVFPVRLKYAAEDDDDDDDADDDDDWWLMIDDDGDDDDDDVVDDDEEEEEDEGEDDKLHLGLKWITNRRWGSNVNQSDRNLCVKA